MQVKIWKVLIGFVVGIAIASLCGIILQAPLEAQSLDELLTKEAIAPVQINQSQLNTNPNGFVPRLLRQSDQPSSDRGVIGADQRQPMMSRDYPWSTVGKVVGLTDKNEKYSCTGTLIGEYHVLTNAHCVYDRGKLAKKMIFLPNLINGRLRRKTDYAVVKRVVAGTKNSENDSADDWAILLLNKPLGEKYGFLKWKPLSLSLLQDYKKQLFVAGYSVDYPDPKRYADLQAGKGETAGVHVGCSVVDELDGMFVHDCDTNSGASGSALIGKINGAFHIVGLHAAGLKSRTGKGIENYAVQIRRIEEGLEEKAGN
ncbi:MAG: trypsin-like serine peptidase [Pseudanabaena sp.]